MQRRLAALAFATLALDGAPADARHRPQPSPSPTVSPTPLPTPPSETLRFAQLHRDIAAIAAQAPGRMGIAVVDLLQFTRFTANADQAFALASIANVPIALAAFRRADQRVLDFDERVEIGPADLRRGTSGIARNHPHGGATYTYAELLRATLIESDTTASDRVLRELGGPAGVDTFLVRAGVTGFDLRKSEADLLADAVAHRTFATGADNSATPNAVANLFTGIARSEFLRFDSNIEFLQLLSEVRTGEARLRAGLPPGSILAHSTGTSATIGQTTDATNDAGILTLPNGRRVVIVAFLGESKAPLADREATLARVARAVYRAYMP